jgi:hypothetical protein
VGPGPRIPVVNKVRTPKPTYMSGRAKPTHTNTHKHTQTHKHAQTHTNTHRDTHTHTQEGGLSAHTTRANRPWRRSCLACLGTPGQKPRHAHQAQRSSASALRASSPSCLPNTVAADRCGGACASQITRQQLIQQGVPLQRIKKTPKYSRPASGFVNFLAKKQSQKLQPLKGEEYKAWRASGSEDYPPPSDGVPRNFSRGSEDSPPFRQSSAELFPRLGGLFSYLSLSMDLVIHSHM